MLIRILVALFLTAACAAQQPAIAIRNVRLFDGMRVVPTATVVFERASSSPLARTRRSPKALR